MQVLVDIHDSRRQCVPRILFRPSCKHSQKVERDYHHGLRSALIDCVELDVKAWSSPVVD
eukprot:1153008-Amphidinium_carterae.1